MDTDTRPLEIVTNDIEVNLMGDESREARDIRAFSRAMLWTMAQQRPNKNGYDDVHPLWLQAKLTEEIGEIGELLAALYKPDGSRRKNRDMLVRAFDECIDVANVALMLASNLAAWRYEK